DGSLDELGGVQAGLGEVQQRPAPAVLGDVLLVHPDDVGGVADGGLGGELVPAAAPFAGLEADGDRVVDLLEGLDDLLRALVAGGVSPPGEPERGRAVRGPATATAAGVGAAGGEAGESGDGEAEGEGCASGEHGFSCHG